MKLHYNILDTIIPQEQRADINEKILNIIYTGNLQGITKEDIFNAYTGIGGLHGLKREDFRNYHEYAEAKKEIEFGQFFTPHQICKSIVELVNPKVDDTVADITCGMGNFFNYFTQENCFGSDIDKRAVEVAKFLYPNAHIKSEDMKYFKTENKVDYVIGNPPFNIKINGSNSWDYVMSQFFFFQKSAEILKPGGLILAIVPESFLADEFFNKSNIEDINELFDFIGQYKLDQATFKQMGVKSFPTKVMCFQRKSEHTQSRNYNASFLTYEELKLKISDCLKEKDRLKVKLLGELVQSANKEFEYKVKKYLYEIKRQPSLRKYLSVAIGHLEKFRNQEPPEGLNKSDRDHWEKHKLTENKVLSYLRRIINKQSQKQIDKIELVKTNYGFKYKAYSEKTKKQLQKIAKTEWKMYEIVSGIDEDFQDVMPKFSRLIQRKVKQYQIQNASFKDVKRNMSIDYFLEKFSFIDKEGNICYFNKIQKTDLGLQIQKRYSILAWQMGGGKTAASFAWSKYNPQRNTFIVSASLAINLTWAPFLEINNTPFVQVKTMNDVVKIKTGDFVLLSFDFLVRYEKQLKKYVKSNCQKINLIFDESDEITNNSAKRTRSVLNIFRKVKRKYLTTGTTTRNNIGELYSQLELLYNNSVNFMSWSERYYIEEKDYDYVDGAKVYAGMKVEEHDNKYFQKPFPAYYGQTMFRRCFNPSKSSVFGIQKQNQDLYNEDDLRTIIEKTIITRKFKEIAGDKYKVENVKVFQGNDEREVYRTIIKDFGAICNNYFNSTGNSRKDALLRIIRQLSLMIEATSTPQMFDFYSGDGIPNKAKKIFRICEESDEKIAIGCTSIKATDWYFALVQSKFPFRQIFKIEGDVSFNKRKKIIKEFEATTNGILVCTQQSLKSSVNIPTCDLVVIESLQWNIPKIEQFYFRFIRYNSKNITRVLFVNYENTIEMNLLALLMAKERLNDFVKTLEYKENSNIYEEYDIDLDILNTLISKEKDEEGNIKINWGEAKSV